MSNSFGATLESVRQERAARADTGLPAPGRTTVPAARSAPLRILARVFSFVVFGVLIAALALAAIATVPGLFGYNTYTIDGDSMEPALSVGDAAVTKTSSSRDLEVGDVIVRGDFQGGRPVLHRIIDIVTVDGQVAFITQGDQNNEPDAQPVFLAGTGDKVIYRVPYAGYLLSFAGTWAGRLVLIGLPLVLLAGLFLSDVPLAFRSLRRIPNAPAGEAATPQTPASIPDLDRLANQLNSWALRRFVLRHSGGYRHARQCAHHPPISGMATLQVLAAFKDETGIAATSQRIVETCTELGVPYERAGSATANGYGHRAA